MSSVRLRVPPVGAALGLVLAIGGCSVFQQPSPSPVSERPAVQKQKPPPIPTRALNVAADCSFKDPTGYRGVMKLKVASADVKAFEARVDVPNKGVCRFDLKDFRQTATLPNVALKANGSSCVVHMWEQGSRVTVAFNNCQKMCSGDAYTYLWPILANARNGSCG